MVINLAVKKVINGHKFDHVSRVYSVYTVVVNQDWLANLVSILEKVINGHKFDPKMKLVINW